MAAIDHRMPLEGQPAVLSRRQMAALLDVRVKTISKWVRCGMIPAPFYIGRQPRWLASDVITRLQFNRARPRAARHRDWASGQFTK